MRAAAIRVAAMAAMTATAAAQTPAHTQTTDLYPFGPTETRIGQVIREATSRSLKPGPMECPPLRTGKPFRICRIVYSDDLVVNINSRDGTASPHELSVACAMSTMGEAALCLAVVFVAARAAGFEWPTESQFAFQQAVLAAAPHIEDIRMTRHGRRIVAQNLIGTMFFHIQRTTSAP
jgi:hypothetical protein